MKKKLAILSVLLIITLTLGACANTDENNQSRQNQDQDRLETKASSIFQQADVKNMKVTSKKVEVKSGPSDKFKTIATLNKDETARVLAQIKDWYVIQLENDRIGSVNSDETKPVVEEGQPRPPQPQPAPQPEQLETPEPENPQENPPAEEVEPVDDLSSMEREMVNLINEARKNNDVEPLKTDNELTRVARMKSQDMVENDYFSHYSPTYGSPFDMLNKFGIEYLQAGENIAGNSSVEAAHRGLMDSTGHRRNILNPQYTHVGVGIKSSDKYGYVFTQLFISKPQ